MVFLKVLLFFIIVWLIRFIIEKDNLNKAKRLNDQFKKWVQTNGESQRPNSAEFAELFDVVYKYLGSDNKEKEEINEESKYVSNSLIKQNFPSLHGQMSLMDETALDKIYDYYNKRYSENFSFSFWIKFYAFLPEHLVKWFGIEPNSAASKAIDFAYWLVITTIAFIKPILWNLVNHLLR